MRVVVTGVNGFVGQHMTQELVSAGHTVVGCGLGPVKGQAGRLLSSYFSIDLRKQWPSVQCDAVIHLAALSAVGPSFIAPQQYIDGNSAPVTQLGEALLAQSARTRVLVVSTGAVYQGQPGVGWNESTPVVPTSPYIVSKLLTEIQCDYYRQRGLDIVVARPFNHIGPGQRNGFLLPDLVEGVRRWQLTGQPIPVGNLGTRRDYTDVRDVVRAYRLAVESVDGLPPVLNVCSGRPMSGHDLLALVSDTLSPNQRPTVVVDNKRLRPGDPEDITGDSSLLQETLGWAPRIPIELTVKETIAAFQQSVGER